MVAMAYGSGAGKIQDLLKCTKQEADEVYAAYHELYKGTADYAKRSIKEAAQDGYTTGAYDLKLRTPLTKSKRYLIMDEEKLKKAPKDIKKALGSEGRTLNNMRIQSYGLLTNRAGIEIQRRIERDNMEENVILSNQIHDALYLVIKCDVPTITWVNKNLMEAMNKDYREGQVIHLEAELDIGPSWDKQYTLPNTFAESSTALVLSAIKNGKDGDGIKDLIKSLK